MAHKQTVTNNAVKDLMFGANFFWNITDNVGYGYKNNKSDVLLVQFFLNSAVLAYNHFEKTDYSLLVQDGKFGGKTWVKIKWLQKHLECVVDGMISAPNGDNLHTPKQGQVYTMYYMNGIYKRMFGHYYPDLRIDPKCPSELRSHFTVSDDIFD